MRGVKSINFMPAVSPDKIVMMEDHHEAYDAWKKSGVQGRTLIHIDAHIDFGWIPEMDLDEIGNDGKSAESLQTALLNPFIKTRKRMVDIGNYICPAMREGIVERFYWVIPDASWRSRRGKRHIEKYLNRILKVNGSAGGKLEFRGDHARCRIFDKEVIVCSLEGLGRIDAPVLLDIDVDFMLTEFIWDDLNPERTPWIFPEELFRKLSSKISDIDILTIAYSVEGGFTPLRFKYLGDELGSLFEGSISKNKQKIMQYKIKALSCEKEKKAGEAAAVYEEALRADDSDASLYFNLSLLQQEKAAYLYSEALRRDKTYATRYNNYGILYLRHNKIDKAEAEYRKALRIHKDDADIFNGLGHIALAKKRYAEAKELFEKCLSINKSHADARLGKGEAHFRTDSFDEAERLFLGLVKYIPDDQSAYWWLGRIAERKGDISLAVDNYKNAVLRGGEGALVHLRLARLYIIKGLYYRAFEELHRAIAMIRISF